MALPEDGRKAQAPGESDLRSAVFYYSLQPGGLHQAGVGSAPFYPDSAGNPGLEGGYFFGAQLEAA